MAHLNLLYFSQDPDTSFGSEGLPPGLDNTMNGPGDPLPLGDEVSEGRLSEARMNQFRNVPIFREREMAPSPRHDIQVAITPRSQSPAAILPTFSEKIQSNPNRVTGMCWLILCFNPITMYKLYIL